MSGWIKCSERMPPIMDDVIAVRDNGDVIATWWNGVGWDTWDIWGTRYSRDDVTHWMPLPELPPEGS